MQLKECYELFGGNYEDVKCRLMKDDMIKRFVIKFLSDQSYAQLDKAMEQKNYQDAFHASHTLKGLSKNFSFDRLSASTEVLTETLRKWESIPVDEELCDAQWKQVASDYKEVIDAIKQLQASE